MRTRRRTPLPTGHSVLVDLQEFIEKRGGIASTSELHTIGHTRDSITRAIRADAIERVRQGWYCNPWLEVEAKHAVRVGGQLACSSAARFWRLWVPSSSGALHVAVERNACQLRTRTSSRTRRGAEDDTARIHWSGRDHSVSRVVVPPATALRQIALCHDAEYARIVAESALNAGRISAAEFEVVIEGLPRTRLGSLSDATALSGSGIETIFVSRMKALGLEIRQQAFLPGVGYVDALIGNRLVVELDGAAHHRDDARDRRRDAVSSVTGYRVLRFLANQVLHEWDLVAQAVLAAVFRGDHLTA